MKNNTFLKITAIYFFMFFVGPLIWGVWMVFKLDIIALQEFLHCIVSPASLALFFSYFFFNFFYMKGILRKISGCPINIDNERENRTYYLPVLRVHCLSIVTFGTIGTFTFMMMTTSNTFRFFEIIHGGSLLKIMIGTLSGTSLVCLFYILFSTIILTSITSNIPAANRDEAKKVLVNLKLFNVVLYVIGLVLFISTSIASLIYNYYRSGKPVAVKDIAILLATLIFPVLMSGLMYNKARKRINTHIGSKEDTSKKDKSAAKKRTLVKIKLPVQICFFILFFTLLLTGYTKIWLFILIAGFCISLFKGRIYCSWCCPVNTTNRWIEWLYKRVGIKKINAARWLYNPIPGIICFVVFLGLFIFSLVQGIRFQLFTVITFLGILISSLFTPSLWCICLCPWGMIMRVMSKFVAFKQFIFQKRRIQ